MGLSKTEVNLRRLLTASPKQQNQAKLIHYITTLRELLEQLGAETASEGISSISKAKLNEYSEKIEALAANLASPLPEPVEAVDGTSLEGSTSKTEQAGNLVNPSPGLRRRHISRTDQEDITHQPAETDSATPVKLDASAQAHIEKHRQLQEDLTDDMVMLARQLKESSLVMSQSLQDTEKILDSTEKSVEHSLASTGRANARAVEIYSESSKTSCFTWLVMFAMTFTFVMVVLLIRVT